MAIAPGIERENRPPIRQARSPLSAADRWDHVLARWGVRRGQHRVDPGLYALGQPRQDSPVFVTANYTLSFDALRSALAGRDAYILVLDTKGINVWCAAGKGTFGTDELVKRIEETRLAEVVSHRRLILPQLGAPGVAGFEVRMRSGFKVAYGPVRAADLPAYLESGATPAMRQVRFHLADRLVLVPVELVHTLLPMLGAAVLLYLLAGLPAALAAIAAVLAGTVLFPLLFPWLPTGAFSTRGFLLGALVALPFVAWELAGTSMLLLRLGTALALLLGVSAAVAFLALNFTGSTPLASRTGVRREIYRYIPAMAGSAGVALLLVLAGAVARWIGGYA
jgi:hypothetical protein